MSTRLLVYISILAALASPAVPAQELKRSGTFLVALDIGQSPKAPGAMSVRNVPEYEFNKRMVHLSGADKRGARMCFAS